MKMKCSFLLLLCLLGVLGDDDESPLGQFVNFNHSFTVLLYEQIMRNNEANFLISPFSTGTFLRFLQSGCKGETSQEIRKSVHLPDIRNQTTYGTKEYIAALKGNDRYTVHVANICYVKNGYTINEEFKKLATEIYGADVENIEFTSQEKVAKTMNEWIQKQTRNRTENLINPLLMDDNVKTVLINTICFRGNWTKPFSRFTTKPTNFFKTKYGRVKADTMHQYRAWFNYYENSELDAGFLEMPFEGGDVSMIIVLPNKRDGLAALEKDMQKIFVPQNLRQEFVNVALPKFKIETTLNLVQTLKNLGIKKVFDGNEADLSTIAGEKGELVINSVLQKTFIEIQEGGVESTDTPYVSIADDHLLIGGVSEPRSKDFIADHPFIFYVKVKNFIIFAGRVSDPQV